MLFYCCHWYHYYYHYQTLLLRIFYHYSSSFVLNIQLFSPKKLLSSSRGNDKDWVNAIDDEIIKYYASWRFIFLIFCLVQTVVDCRALDGLLAELMELQWGLNYKHRVSPGLAGSRRVSPRFAEFRRVSLGFAESRRVSPGFGEFQRVSSGFTGFRRVSVTFAGFWHWAVSTNSV